MAAAYRNGKALNAATHFEIDDVIDPAETRARVLATLAGRPAGAARQGKKRPCVDTWWARRPRPGAGGDAVPWAWHPRSPSQTRSGERS